MKKRMGYFLLAAMLALQLCGCGRGEDTQGAQDTTGASSWEAEDAGESGGLEISVGSGGILDPTAVLTLDGKDNSLDAYSAAARFPLQSQNPENALIGGVRRVFLGASRAYNFKKHLFRTTAECWDELSFVTAEGETGLESFDWDHTLWDIGPAAGTDHYVVFELEEQEDTEELRYFFTERDENDEKLRDIPLDFLSGSSAEVLPSLSDFAADQSGVVHLLQYTEEGTRYFLVSQEGEVLAEYTPKGNYSRKLVPLYDGRVALLSLTAGNGGEIILQHMDVETGMLVTLSELKELGKNPYYATLLDENTLLYADREGVYRCGLSGRDTELIYRWIDHGIIVQGISGMQAEEEGRIVLIYEDSEDYNYLCLEPTTEEVPLCEITMAVRSGQSYAYEWLVAEFNKQYPSCHIELAEYEYGDTALLTQLTAGKGPVLIDTFLVNFEELEELWEPLDTVMGQLGITEALYPVVLETGKINGNLYGMSIEFSLRTVVAIDQELNDWDYDEFVSCAQDRPELEALFNYYSGESGPYSLILEFLNHGIEDNYFFVQDAETGAMYFDSDRFRDALELAEKYCTREEGVSPGSSLWEGRTLCNTVNIYKPEHIAAYRSVYGEDISYVGFPTKDGAAHFVEFSRRISIRQTAAKEEKEAAAAFIAMCLSYESQSHMAGDIFNYAFEFSPRMDVLEEQLLVTTTDAVNISGYGDIKLGSRDVELDKRILLDMVNEARPAKDLPRELNEIISEEMELYYGGVITEDMLIDHLESRVGLYLGERN